MAEAQAGNRRKKSSDEGIPWAMILILLLLLGFCYQILQQEATKTEVTILLTGLVTSIFGPAESRNALPQGPPVLPRDVYVLVFFVLAIFLMNWTLRLAVVEPFARLAVGIRGDTLVKFSQSVLEAIIYGTFAIIGISIVPAQPWSWPSANWWRGFDSGEHLIMRSDLRCFYILYGARYIQAAVTVLLEPKRKDFLEMMVHHIVTIGVVYVSYLGGYNRVGVVVMVLLDPADVPLHLAKLCKYTAEQLKMNIWQFVADRLFEFFAVLFAVTRLIMFGPRSSKMQQPYQKQLLSADFNPVHAAPCRTRVQSEVRLLAASLACLMPAQSHSMWA
ncbi:unnamed protein product [Symbiodinium pilosum]|uniref:TLC domain-containing protein n=1 Tax=Symbiodinium pilosum TaxID=2952 RepID=A0A812RUD1_SYMPI|nr:unnamed protein product [Symbiodinium pilosum]